MNSPADPRTGSMGGPREGERICVNTGVAGGRFESPALGLAAPAQAALATEGSGRALWPRSSGGPLRQSLRERNPQSKALEQGGGCWGELRHFPPSEGAAALPSSVGSPRQEESFPPEGLVRPGGGGEEWQGGGGVRGLGEAQAGDGPWAAASRLRGVRQDPGPVCSRWAHQAAWSSTHNRLAKALIHRAPWLPVRPMAALRLHWLP